MSLFPVIDYDSHPGFAGLGMPESNESLDGLISDIEAAYLLLLGRSVALDQRLLEFDRDIVAKIQDLQRAIVGREHGSPDFSRFVSNAFASAQQSLRDYLSARGGETLAHNSGPAAMRPSLVNALADFRRDGFFSTHNAAIAKNIWRKTALERAQLRAKKR